MAAVHRNGNFARYKTRGISIVVDTFNAWVGDGDPSYLLQRCGTNKKEDSIKSSFLRSESDSQAALIFAAIGL
jgi:hypothetical protein